MKDFDVITFGSATRDVFLRSRQIKIVADASFSTGEAECFALGSKIEVDEIVFETGGGATNTAAGFERQGLDTAFVGRIGHADARGQEIVDALRAAGVNTGLVVKDRRAMTAYSVILLTNRGERTVLVYRGASADFRNADIPWSKLHTSWFYVSSLAGAMPVLKKLWHRAEVKKTKIAWNPGVGELQHGWKTLLPLIKQTDVFSVNQEEATSLTGFARDQVRAAFDRLRQTVRGVTIVTLGADGSLAGDRNRAWQAGTHPVTVIDTTGAGDAFGCGFVGALIRNNGNIPLAMQCASANSESVIRSIGAKAGLLTGRKPTQPVPVVPYRTAL